MNNSQTWYIVKREHGRCEILPHAPTGSELEEDQATLQYWGPFESKTAAIAHRIGLIRAGKCQLVQPQA